MWWKLANAASKTEKADKGFSSFLLLQSPLVVLIGPSG